MRATGAIEPTGVIIDGEDATPHLRDAEVEANVSLVSRVPGVRAALVRIQRDLAADGRRRDGRPRHRQRRAAGRRR